MKKILITVLCMTAIITAILLSGKFVTKSPEEQTTETTTQIVDEEQDEEDIKSMSSISLPYFRNKSFNPFKTKSPTNLSLSTLLYDSLFILNADCSSTMLLAKEFHNDGKKVTVKLIDGITFSNGNSLTAYDVVYSFKLAKKCDSFKGRLSNFTSAKAGTDTVTFTLRQPDVYAQQCLTFPIVQNGTGTASLPIGSGRYILRSISGHYVLAANTNNTRGETLNTKIIGLVPITADKEEIYRVQTGELSYYYNDMDTGAFTKLTAKTVPVQTNNLIYLGYKDSNSAFKDKQIIEALQLAIDKNTLADNVFDNFCTLTETPFNPNWFALKDLKLPVHEYNLIRAGNILDENGYTYSKNDRSYRYDSNGYFDVKIIVNKESTTKVNCAKFIGKALQNLGLRVSLKALSFNDYIDALEYGDYDLYIGEVRISPNMDLGCFFNKGGNASYGITSSTIRSAYSDFKTGNIDINTFIGVFEEEIPFIPICYRTGIAYYSNEISFDGDINEYEPFKNANTWIKK